jgi:DNA-binding FadR family transcriptional regulator
MNAINGIIDDKARTLGRRTATIVEDIGEAIVTGGYKPDELLPVESELTAKYDASRSVLREAVKVLNAKGLITARPRKGTSITQPSNWNLFDPDVLRWILRGNFSLPLLIEFTQIRLAIEPMAASLAARQGTNEALQAIEAACQYMGDCVAQGEDDLLADIAFHLAILDASGNQFFSRLKPLVNTALRFSIKYTDAVARDEVKKLEAHRAVVDAIQARDPQAASQASYVLLSDVLSHMNAPV